LFSRQSKGDKMKKGMIKVCAFYPNGGDNTFDLD